MSTIDLPDGEYIAVVDSIEDGLATVFFEHDDDEVGDAVLDASILPEDGRHADAILSVTVVDGIIDETHYDSEKTETRSEAAQNRFDRLSRRPPSKDES
ncbi:MULTISPECIES: DUF3006 family protein [Halorubrum]|jgi:hypothetical protein|uniref:DUF3006 family protein n=1 Tax=Halorubrum ezzemoulense TaxID=337243 RepID=A0ABT4Z8Y0_HALEZ|nr:DUF3006 family protein [Halorubrum ezzemoulense]MDB2242593.1 DUF3006 family protein [Halorubrum ezzemoulense]MDB2246088.1 DUF3006 family protein [Halorubrum ezzemoulense]MDB2279736.1 DUF3006 family protein [Halorubrum ezzemoulense]MDB2290161.1 DUF3006 family protein [Halorubrum ezzemoulense]MDB2293950.1 DUF3006 family protein [Halorubrum ezzemoulense]